MLTNENSDIIICDRELCLDIILPEELNDIEERMKEELGIQFRKLFIPYNPKKTADFGLYGRRWHVKVVIPASQEQEFYDSLRRFCIEHKLSLNENGRHPFKKMKKE